MEYTTSPNVDSMFTDGAVNVNERVVPCEDGSVNVRVVFKNPSTRLALVIVPSGGGFGVGDAASGLKSPRSMTIDGTSV